MSTKNSPHSKIHAEAARAAQHTFDNWRKHQRKDPDWCQIGIAMDDGFRFVHIKWTDLEKATIMELTVLFCETMRRDAGTYKITHFDNVTMH